MRIEIREYRQTDFYALRGLLADTYGTKIDQETLEKKYINETRMVLVAVIEESTLVGCAFVELQEDFIRPCQILYVTYVAVDSKYRRNGIGKRLMSKIEDMCEKKECSAIELTSANFRSDAHAFYESLGFTKKKTTIYIKDVILR